MSAAVTHRARQYVRDAEGWSTALVVETKAELRRDIRAARLAVTGSILSLSVPSWSPVKAWQAKLKRPYNADRRRAEQQLAALEEIHPTKPFWKPRPSTAADKRIAKQYGPGATPLFPACALIVATEHAEQDVSRLSGDRDLYAGEFGEKWPPEKRMSVKRELRAAISRLRLCRAGIIPDVHPLEPEKDWGAEFDAIAERSAA